MTTKVINSYDIHVYTQQLRIVEKKELLVNIEGYENRELLVNEPRGSKYVNLLIYEYSNDVIEVEIEAFASIDNIEILLKSFVSSLLDRHQLQRRELYKLKYLGENYHFKHSELSKVYLPQVNQEGTVFKVNNKNIIVKETRLDLSVSNMNAIKDTLETMHDKNYDYLVLKGHQVNVVANKDRVIIAYPVMEVISILRNVFKKKEITSFNGLTVHVEKQLPIEYYLISNSQFYIDDTDIYNKGFIIK